MAAKTRIAFSNASLARIRERQTFSLTRSTMRRPAMRARRYLRASTAGIAALPGMPTPSASIIDAIVDAVPIVMQWPWERCMQDSASWNSSSEIAVEHRGRTQQRLAERHDWELERKAPGLGDALAHVVGEDAEVRVARRQLGPGIADADHRAAVEHVVRHAAVLHPAAIDEPVDVLAREPLDRTLLRIGLFHLIGGPAAGNV